LHVLPRRFRGKEYPDSLGNESLGLLYDVTRAGLWGGLAGQLPESLTYKGR